MDKYTKLLDSMIRCQRLCGPASKKCERCREIKTELDRLESGEP